MGRWGQRLFECDEDLAIAEELNIIFMATDHPDAFDHRQSLLPKRHHEAIRARLDNGIGKHVFSKLRSEEYHPKNALLAEGGGIYRVIILGALMMRLGTRIDQEDLDHLRIIASEVSCREGYQNPALDDGFRDPGKKQFLAALRYYKPGTPRDFECPSCAHCGNIQMDTGKPLTKCAGCQGDVAWFCSKECEMKNWPIHRKSCASVVGQGV